MATFNVFVDGAIDGSPTGLPRLAEAMAKRYGLQPTDLVSRLRNGRFRVKSNVDAPTAEKYKRDLESIGALVLIEDSSISPTATPPAGVARTFSVSLPPPTERKRMSTPPAGTPVKRPSTPAAGTPAPRPSTPPAGTPAQRPSAPPSALAGHAQRPSQPIPASGLAAAFTDTGQQDLGALSGGALSLAALDGSEDMPPPKPAPPPPPEPSDAAFAPPPPKPAAKPAAKPKPKVEDAPVDLFAPPDAEDANFVVDLATEEVEERAAKRASVPPPNVTQTPVAPTPVALADAAPRRFSRPHFIAGVVIALVAGFVPAHFIGAMREKSAFLEIDGRVAAAHASVDSFETYQALDAAREKFLDEKQDKRQSIALTSMLLWALISAGVGFGLLHYGRFAHPRG